jgi:hypothetical protein
VAFTDYGVHDVVLAGSLEVVFSSKSATERNYDYIRLYTDDSHTSFYGEEKYTGGRGM